jgi:outer membrane receptor protein involved in Fe transport
MLVLLVNGGISAQTFRAGLHGTIVDPAGALIVGANVKAANDSTGLAYLTSSSSSGDFVFQDLPIGTYTVTAHKDGFRDVVTKGIPLEAGAVYSLPVRLEIATSQNSVEVIASTLRVETSTVTQANVLDDSTIEEIPVNGRDFTQLLTLTAGYSGYGVGFMSAINGTQGSQVNWQIEGADNNDLMVNTSAVNQGGVYGIPGVLLPLDSVEEFSVVTQGSAEAGRNPGAVANLLLKSGTNQLHGTAYYFNRNEALAAISPFAANGSEKQEIRNQQYGGSFGGPIRKNSTFYYGAFERQGFLIGIPGFGTEPSLAYQAAAEDVLNNPGNKYGAYGPIPMNPGALALLQNLWPANALTGPASPGNYFNPGHETGYSNNGIAKFDHSFSSSHRISLNVFAGGGSQTAPLVPNSYLTPYFQHAPMHVENWSLVDNAVFSPRFTSQFTFGFNFFHQTFSDLNHSYNPVALGFNTGVTNPALSGAPNITIGGFDQVGLTPTGGREDITGHINEALSYVVGKHQFRFGGEVRRGQVYDNQHAGQRGVFSFQPLTSSDPWKNSPLITDGHVWALADFLKGDVYTASIVQGDPARKVFQNSFALFGQDNWQVTPQLNLNLGLRYDYIGPIHDGRHDLSTFLPSQGLVLVGSGISSLYPQQWDNLGPRVGFAYQPPAAHDFVIRGAFGLYYDTVNVSPFLANSFVFNGGPNGVEENSIGSNPAVSVSLPPGSPLPSNGSPIFANASAGGFANVYSISQHFRTPYTYNFSLNIQQGLGKSAIMQVGCVGSLSRHLLQLIDLNQAALLSDFNPANFDANGNNMTRPYYTRFPQYGVIDEIQTRANSNYNSLQASLRTLNWHGVVSQFHYTWAHALDISTFGGAPQDSTNPGGDYGNSDFDTRHNFTAFVQYQIPGSSGGPKWLTHGWTVNSTLSFRSGLPFNLDAIGDWSGTGENLDRPVLVGNPYAGVSHQASSAGVYWFNPAAFAFPNPGSFGTFGRNQLYGPNFKDVDLSFDKSTPITERVQAILRFELFNIFNRANLGNPTFEGANLLFPTGPGSPPFAGPIISTNGAQFGVPGIGPGEPFNVQLALKLQF